MTGLVHRDLSGDFDGLQKCHLGSDVGFRGWNKLRCNFWSLVVDGRGGGDIGGPNILSLLAKLPLGSCERLGEMFAENMRGEAGPSGVIASIAGRGLYQYNWAESGAMEITDDIRLSRNFVGAVSIRCGESQSVSDGDFRARIEVDIV